MRISRVDMFLVPKDENGVVAECRLVFDNVLMVNDIKLRECDNGYIEIRFPERIGKEGEVKMVYGKPVPWDVVHPTTESFQRYVENRLLREYWYKTETMKPKAEVSKKG